MIRRNHRTASCLSVLYHNDFLYKQVNSPRSYDIVLYGSGLETEKLEGKVDYKGFVSSDELIATAEGEYGLAWYGSSLEGGSGALGEYLQYNAPHKMSLHTLRSSDV